MGKCLCRAGFAELGDECVSCNYRCIRCEASNTVKCIECNYGRTKDPITNKCECIPGKF